MYSLPLIYMIVAIPENLVHNRTVKIKYFVIICKMELGSRCRYYLPEVFLPIRCLEFTSEFFILGDLSCTLQDIWHSSSSSLSANAGSFLPFCWRNVCIVLLYCFSAGSTAPLRTTDLDDPVTGFQGLLQKVKSPDHFCRILLLLK